MTDDRTHIIDPARFLSEQLEQASADLMRSMLTTFNALMRQSGRGLSGSSSSAVRRQQYAAAVVSAFAFGEQQAC
jgi:hypothetical protein